MKTQVFDMKYVFVLIVRHGSIVMIDSVYNNLAKAQNEMAVIWKDKMKEFYGDNYLDYVCRLADDLYTRIEGYKNFLDSYSGLVAHPDNSDNEVMFVINSYKVK